MVFAVVFFLVLERARLFGGDGGGFESSLKQTVKELVTSQQ